MLLYRDEYEVRVNTINVYDVWCYCTGMSMSWGWTPWMFMMCDVIVQGWVWAEGEHYKCLWCVMLLYRDEYEVRVNTMSNYDVWYYCTGMSMRWGWIPWMFMMCDVIVQGWVWAEGEHHKCLWCYCTGMSISWGWEPWVLMMCVILLYRDEYEVRVNTMNVYDVWCYCTEMSMSWGWTP